MKTEHNTALAAHLDYYNDLADQAEVARMAAALAGLDLDDAGALDALRNAPWAPGLPVCYGQPGSPTARAFDPAQVDRLGLRAIAAARARGAA